MRYLFFPIRVKKELPKDWDFMRQSGEVLASPPKTWAAYPDDVDGYLSIISMEYNELMKAPSPADKMRELVHLASACLNLWRFYHDTAESR